MTKRSPFKCFRTSPEIIRLAGLLYVWLLLSRRNVKDLMHERGIEISYDRGSILVAAFWADVCVRDQKAPDSRFEIQPLAVTLG